jgi:hypothetical protein
VARAFRKKKEPPPEETQPQQQPAPAHAIIDNDNLTQVMDDAESRHLTSTSFLYSFDGAGKTFQVSSPDVMCSLSFNGRSSSLLSHPFVQTDLPDDEMRKLNGPATISEEGLQVSVFNGTQWRVEEITVGLTIVHRDNPTAGYHGGEADSCRGGNTIDRREAAGRDDSLSPESCCSPVGDSSFQVSPEHRPRTRSGMALGHRAGARRPATARRLCAKGADCAFK